MKGKKITLLICGGIAAYKMVDTVSALTKQGAQVTCVLTQSARKLVSDVALSTMSKRNVYTDDDYFDPRSYDDGVIHIKLAQETDLIVLAPATANTIAKFRYGIADNLVLSILLAADKPVLVFPAMNDVMLSKNTTQENIRKISANGAIVVDPDTGMLACDTVGKGRLPETDEIIEYIRCALNGKKDLAGKKVLINAGGTREMIDVVRCITNLSTGKMGIALAREAFLRGAHVTLVIAGKEDYLNRTISIIKADSAQKMLSEMETRIPGADIVIFAAAVADFKPISASVDKIKKSEGLNLTFIQNTDIAKELGKSKQKGMVFVGFSAETKNLVENAGKKLEAKNFDFIFANDVSRSDIGFGSDNNAGYIIKKGSDPIEVTLRSKDEIAGIILDQAAMIIKNGE